MQRSGSGRWPRGGPRTVGTQAPDSAAAAPSIADSPGDRELGCPSTREGAASGWPWRERARSGVGGGGEARFERDAAEQPPPDLSLRPTGRPTGALGPRGTGSPATRGQRRAARQPRPSPDGQLGSRAGGPAARGNRCARRGAGRRRRRPAAPGSGHSRLARGRGIGVRPKLGLRACRSLRARSWETFFLLQPLKRAAQGKVVWNSLFPAGEPLPRRFNGNFAGLPQAWELLSPRRKKWGCLSH